MNVMFNIWVIFTTFGILALLAAAIVLIMYASYLIKTGRRNK